jgi:FkbM family methyltransferase
MEHLTSMRKCGIEGVDELLWITEDSGAYGDTKDGPLFDWIMDSKHFMSHVKNFDTVIQAGGNCGMYPRFYGNYFKNVHTFEPDELNFYCLDQNCQGDNYHKYQGGLGNTTDKLAIRKPSSTNVGMHYIVDSPGKIQMYRIDDLNLESCDLIHLDIEGYESKALMGGLETIKKFKPVIVTERAIGAEVITPLGYEMIHRMRMDALFVFKE